MKGLSGHRRQGLGKAGEYCTTLYPFEAPGVRHRSLASEQTYRNRGIAIIITAIGMHFQPNLPSMDIVFKSAYSLQV